MKNKKGGHRQTSNDAPKRELLLKENLEEYAKVLRTLGSLRLECYCFDGKTRIAHIRGSMRKRIWISVGDYVLLGIRDFQQDKADVLHKYTTDEVHKLKSKKEINEKDEEENEKGNGKGKGNDDGDIYFEDSDNDNDNENNVKVKPQYEYDLPPSEDSDLDIDNI